ncbi:MAG: glycosyltransferase [Pseudonocardiaceae bacterium]
MSVAVDLNREGLAPFTRNSALAAVTTEWCAFLDDDDQWKPNRVQGLLEAAEETGTEVVCPWREMVGAGDPHPDRFGVLFDAEQLRGSFIAVTSLVRTKLAQQLGFYYRPGSFL